ncbi:hypothetical protein C7E25_23220, partial [Stenotrophomonas maltophilia]
PLLATLHSSLISTPGEMRSGWRRERSHSAGYALGWRTFDYARPRRGVPCRCRAGLSAAGHAAFEPDQHPRRDAFGLAPRALALGRLRP